MPRGTREKDRALAPEGIEALTANASLRIIADHARAATFLINDGVLPANEGRGYVLRKILRRGIRHGRLLGQEQPFLFEMVYPVRDLMDGAYPELKDSAARVAKVVEAEEKQFDRVLKAGMIKLNELLGISNLDSEPDEGAGYGDGTGFGGGSGSGAGFGDGSGFGGRALIGAQAFHLYETYGLPKDFIQDYAHDAGVLFDDAGFEAARAEEQARARASWKGGSQKSASPAFRELPKTDFLGYKQLTATNTEVLAIVKDGVGVPAAAAGDQVDVVLDQTSFYGDSGGQIGDTGWFTSTDGNTTVAEFRAAYFPCKASARTRPCSSSRSPSATASTPSSMATAATPSAAITPELTCSTPRYVKSSAPTSSRPALGRANAPALRLFSLRPGRR